MKHMCLLTCVLVLPSFVPVTRLAIAQPASPAGVTRPSKENPIASGTFQVPPSLARTGVLAAAPIEETTLALAYRNRWGCFIRTIDISGATQPRDGQVVALHWDDAIPATRAEITGSIRQGDATLTFYKGNGEQIVARYGYLAPESTNPWIRIGPTTYHMVIGQEVSQLIGGLIADERDCDHPLDHSLPPAPPSRITLATAGRWVLQLCRDEPSTVLYNPDEPGHSVTIPTKRVPFEKLYQLLKPGEEETRRQMLNPWMLALGMRQTWMKERVCNNVPADPAGVEQVLTELVTLSGDAKLAAILKKRPIFPTPVPSVWSDFGQVREPGQGPAGPIP